MERHKLYTILGTLISLLVIVLIIRAVFGGDEIRPQLEQVAARNQTIQNLSEAAVENSATHEVQTVASTILVTAASDANRLNEVYANRYGEELPQYAPSEAINQLNNAAAGSDFTATYVMLTQGRVEQNIASLESITQQTDNMNTKSIINDILDNYRAHQESLRELAPQ